MVNDLIWTLEETNLLKRFRIDAVRNTPKRLAILVQHFKQPGATVYRVTEGNGPVLVSKNLARKIRNLSVQGSLDWVLKKGLGLPQEEKTGIQSQLALRYPVEFITAVEAYKKELGFRVQSLEIAQGQRSSIDRDLVKVGLASRPFVLALLSDPRMERADNRFNQAIVDVNLDEAQLIKDQINRIIDQITRESIKALASNDAVGFPVGMVTS